MKSLKSTINIDFNIVLVHSLIGVLTGIFVIHPLTMVIYWFEFNPSEFSFDLLLDVFIMRIKHSFNIQMLPMGLIFASIGGLFGLISGLYSKTLKHRKILIAKNKELMELDNIKSNFLQLISHEIRTPLNGILGSVELLKDIVTTDELNEIVDLLEKSATRLEIFSITALKITELRTYAINLKKTKINLRNEIELRLKKFNEKIKQKQITVSYSPESEIEFIDVHVDLKLFGFCLDNILENAIEYCTNNIVINFKKDTSRLYTICEISDDGDGFSSDTLENLFVLFSTKGDHIDNSPGLVFPLLKLIMEAHEGKIEVNNFEKGGARIVLDFPICK